MAGKRVLLATEFLRGRATLTRLLPLAEALVDRGHTVLLAVPAEASVVGFPVFDAPRWAVPPPPGYVALSYADLLMHGGYATTGALRGLMTGWQTVLGQALPDLLIADFAPTAMLAARLSAVPMAGVGDGFSLPPQTAPMPCMRTWDEVAPDRLDSVEGRVLAVINALVGVGNELRHLRDLFMGVPGFLCTFPELDHCVGRVEDAWYGEVFAVGDVPAGTGEGVYVDLDPRHPGLPGVVEALGRLGLPALLHGADGPPMGCDVVVCQGLDVVAPALLAGMPVLMLPVFLEQTMTLHRVTEQGLGFGLAPGSGSAAIEAALRRLLDDRACRQRVANFARSYDGYRPGIAIGAVADEIDGMLVG